MGSSRRIPILWIVAVLVPIALVVCRAMMALTGSKLEIGPETTVVSGPRTPDGLIDYSAAMHERMSAGVKPEDNAAVLIDRAFGPGAISPSLRALYFEWIQTEPFPEQGDYVLTQSALMKQKLDNVVDKRALNEAMFKEFDRAQSIPWTRTDCPLAAEWLDANARTLELIHQVSKRTEYYSPLVTSEGLMQAENNVQNLREAARMLKARAMFRLGENDVAGAWSDLVACHRLARLASQRAPNVIQFLVAVALESVASNGDAALIAHGLSVEQARTCLSEHSQLPSFASLADVMDRGQRLETLDAIVLQLAKTVDLNILLRRTNLVFDDLISALRKHSRSDRNQALAVIEADLDQRRVAASHPVRMAVGVLTGSRRLITESVGESVLALLMPAFTQANTAQMRAEVRRDQVQIGFALATYHAEHGSYPQTLDDLVPKYLDAVPVDRFSDMPLIYTPREDGFLIYSVGANGRDDGGRMRGANKEDDVPFEVPSRTDE